MNNVSVTAAAMTNPALVLGIESSCDETGVALAQILPHATIPRLLALGLHSQIDMHQAYGGVVPELASRDHIRRVVPLVRQVMQQAAANWPICMPLLSHEGPDWPAPCLLAPVWPARWLPRWTSP